MKSLTITAAMMMAMLGAGCGKDKGGGGGEAAGGGAAGGPPCSEAAAAYAKNLMDSGGNPLYSLKPTPEQLKEVTTKLEASCTAGWSAKSKECVIKAAPMGMGKCWKDAMEGARVSQVVFDYVQATKPATP